MSGASYARYLRRASTTRAFWLPPNGLGNGLDARSWAVIADVPAHATGGILGALRPAGVPAFGSDVRPGVVRLWVDPLRYATAEDVIGDVLRRLSSG